MNREKLLVEYVLKWKTILDDQIYYVSRAQLIDSQELFCIINSLFGVGILPISSHLLRWKK